MKILSWVCGIFGVLIAMIGVIGAIRGCVVIEMAGRDHAPSTFILVGLMFLGIGIWGGVLALLERAENS